MIVRQPQMLQMSAGETGQMSAVPESAALPVRAVIQGSTRRGLTRGEESEEGGECALLKLMQKWYPKSEQNCLQKGPQK